MRDRIGKLQARKYSLPVIEVIEVDATDIIITSLGTETTPKDAPDGIWDLDLG